MSTESQSRIAAMRPASAAAPAAMAPKAGSALAAANRQNFQQIDNRQQYRRNAFSPPLPNVLNSFAVERQGSKVRVIDNDGSVYSGEAMEDATAQNQPGSQSFNFRVSGANNQLNQNVVFTGNYQAAAPQTDQQSKTAAQSEQFYRNKAVGATGSLLQQNRSTIQNAPQGWINGRVQIGNTNEFTIDATATP